MSAALTREAAERMAERFQALADPTRLQILDLLGRRDEASVGEIAGLIGGSQQNVSKHLSILRNHRFVTRRKVGTASRYRASDPNVRIDHRGADLVSHDPGPK